MFADNGNLSFFFTYLVPEMSTDMVDVHTVMERQLGIRA
jgi:hypothetical protein